MIARLLTIPERFPGRTIAASGLTLAIAYSIGVAGLPRSHGRIVNGDAIHYYVYLRSLVFDRDLDFANDYKGLLDRGSAERPNDWVPRRTSTGYVRNVMSIGPALVWLPLFLVTSLCVAIARAAGAGYALDGFGRIFQVSAGYSGILAATIGVWWTYRFLTRTYPIRTSIWATLAMWLGSSAVYYTAISPAYSHAASILASSGFFLAWSNSLDRQTPRRYALIGAAAGLAALVRWQDAGLLIVPLLDTLYHRRGLTHSAINLAASTFGFALTFSPQVVTWWILYGAPIIVPQGANFMRWTSPALVSVLISSRHGLLSWTPIIAVAIIGLLVARKTHPLMITCGIAVFAIALYINGAVVDWWAGEAYGARRFLSCFPVFALGLAAVFERLDARPSKLAMLAGVFVSLNGLLVLQYQLAMRGFESIAPYPEGLFDLWLARFLVPFRWFLG